MEENHFVLVVYYGDDDYWEGRMYGQPESNVYSFLNRVVNGFVGQEWLVAGDSMGHAFSIAVSKIKCLRAIKITKPDGIKE